MKTRAPRAPSLRDQEIYYQVKVQCRKQCEVAVEVGRSPGQVSRIIKRVGAWRAACRPEQQGELAHDGQRRLGRWLAQQRTEELYAEARRLVEETGDRGRGSGDSGQEAGPQELRRVALRLQAIKTALRASQETYELTEAEPLPEPSFERDQKACLTMVYKGLVALRKTAQEAGRVQTTLVEPLVESVLQALLGEPQGLRVPGSYSRGSAWWDVAEALTNIYHDPRRRGQDQSAAPIVANEPAPMAQERNFDAPSMRVESSAPLNATSPVGPGTYVAEAPVDFPLGEPQAAHEKSSDLRGTTEDQGSVEVVGSPAWQVARKKWLAERDQRRIDAAIKKYEAESLKQRELEERRQRNRERIDYLPPLDLGYQPPVPDAEWEEQERQRRREYLKSLVHVVVER